MFKEIKKLFSSEPQWHSEEELVSQHITIGDKSEKLRAYRKETNRLSEELMFQHLTIGDTLELCGLEMKVLDVGVRSISGSLGIMCIECIYEYEGKIVEKLFLGRTLRMVLVANNLGHVWTDLTEFYKMRVKQFEEEFSND